MCSNTIKYFSTDSAAARKTLVLLIVICSFGVQLQPVTGDEVPNEGFNSSHVNNRPDLDNNQRLQQQPGNYHPANETGNNSINPCSSNRSFLDRNHPLLITTIVGLALTLLLVLHYLIETRKALLPLKKKVVTLNCNLWKVTSAFENQQDELDEYEKISLAYDDCKVKMESLEAELRFSKQVNEDDQDLIKKFQRSLTRSAKAKAEVEDRLAEMTKHKIEASIQNVLLSEDYSELTRKLIKPINNKYQQTTSTAASDFTKSTVNSLRQSDPEVKGKSRVQKLFKSKVSTTQKPRTDNEELAETSDDRSPKIVGAPKTSPKKKGVFKRTFGGIFSSVRKNKSGSKVSTTQKPGAYKEESPETSDDDPSPPDSPRVVGAPKTTPKKKGLFKRTFGGVFSCVRKDKSGSKEVISKSKRSARLDMAECVELRPP